jgi:hypothetical protein
VAFGSKDNSDDNKKEQLDNHNKKEQLLDFMLHVGLAKTGTTTVQGAMGWNLYDQ